MKRLRHPIRAIREPFGKAGLTVAILALVFAMVGGAYAASGLTGKQKKEVEKIAKKYAGKPGAPGAAGPAGPNGTNGAKGDNGAAGANGTAGTNGTNGTNGTSVTNTAIPAGPTEAKCNHQGGAEFKVGTGTATRACNGVTGFTKTLPSGETETGAWSITQSSTGSVGASTSVSFPIPLAAEGLEGSAWLFTGPEVEQGKWGRKEANTSEPCTVGEPECIDTGCRGTVAKPTAPPGTFCAYTQFASVVPLGKGSVPSEVTNFNFEFNAFGVSGAVLTGGSLNGGAELATLEAVGTWAVTAP